jgi:hypothetical protein
MDKKRNEECKGLAGANESTYYCQLSAWLNSLASLGTFRSHLQQKRRRLLQVQAERRRGSEYFGRYRSLQQGSNDLSV